MRNWKRKLALAGLCGVLAVGIMGCRKEKTIMPEEDSIIDIYMYGSLDETYVPFISALAAKFPEADLRYEYQWDNPGVDEVRRRILHGDGPDLAVVSGTALISLTEQDLLLDLTDTEFSTRYHVSTMTKLNDQGRILGLPLPNDLRCLLCNRGILEENGITQLPRTVPEFMAVCQTLSERGQGAVLADEQLFQMLLRTAYLSKPTGYDWLRAYNNGKGTMAGTPAADAWKGFEELAAVSGCSQEDVSSLPAKRTSLMLEGKYAFRGVALSNMKYMLEADPELDIVALPLLGETEEDQWVFYAEQRNMRYFVANGTLALPENEQKRALVLRMLNWISTEEAQQILASCGSAAISYVNDVELQQGNIMEFLDPVIQTGRLTSSDTLDRGVGDVVAECAAKITGGSMTWKEAVSTCDIQNKEYIPPEEKTGLDEVIGTASAPVYWRKPAAVTVGSPMTQLAAMAMAEAFPKADFAFAMAKNAASTLYPGKITMEDALACSKGEGDSELVLVKATGAQILNLIEAGVGSPTTATFTVPYGVLGKGRLLHPAGLTYRADITKEEGEKVTEITLADGSGLDKEKTYTIIVSALLVDGVAEPNLKDCQVTPTGKYLSDVLVDYIRTHEQVSPPELGLEITEAAPIYTLP